MVLFADHGVAETIYSQKHKSYTAAMAVEASEGLLPFQTSQQHVDRTMIDIGVDRYWASLSGIEDRKVGRGCHNFLTRNALEPQRLEKAIGIGYGLFEQNKDQLVYVSAIAAGSDLSAEALLKSIYSLKGGFSTALDNDGFSKAFERLSIEATHPFDYLERFGGYEMAAMVGMVLAAQRMEGSIILEGWSAIGALAVAFQLNPQVLRHCQITHQPKSSFVHQFFEKAQVQPLFRQEPTFDDGYFLGDVVKMNAAR